MINDYPNPRIYPDLKTLQPSAPEDEGQTLPDDNGQTFRLAKIDDIERFLQDEVKERQKLTKKFRRWYNVVNYIDHGLIFAGVGIGSTGIAVFATGIGAPIGIGLEGVALLACLLQIGLKNATKRLTIKFKKHEAIQNCAQASLNRIHNMISKAISDNTIDEKEFDIIINEKERYLSEKKIIRDKSRKSVTELDEAEKKEIIDKAKKDERERIVKNLNSVPNA